MSIPHKHADLIKAWADGATIQCKIRGCPDYWKDLVNPQWDSKEYRIKPNTIKFRTALVTDFRDYIYAYSINVLDYTQQFEQQPNFIKWLGDWQEVEV
jgi:hypothetical protein